MVELSFAEQDSIRTDSTIVKYFNEHVFSVSGQIYAPLDSTINRIQNYFPGDFPGAIALANRRLLLKGNDRIGFNHGFDGLDLFGFNKDSVRYYNTRTPYTELFALFGSKKEQFFRLLHTQNVTKNWNIAVSLLRIRSEGFYQRQNCTDNNLAFSSNYRSKSNRYCILVNGILSSIKSDENGGIANDSSFENGGLLLKHQLPVNLADARSRRGCRSFYINQFLNLGPKEKVMKGDSVLYYKVVPKNSLSLSTQYNDSWFVYDDKFPTSGFYENVIYDTTHTLDSNFFMTLANKIAWLRYFGENRDKQLKLAYGNYYHTAYNRYLGDSTIRNQSAMFSFGSRYIPFESKWRYNVEGEYFFDGGNKGDEYGSFCLERIFTRSRFSGMPLQWVGVYAHYSDRSVPYIYSQYASNHFQWKNTFDRISRSSIEFKLSDARHEFYLGVSYSNIFNYVYFDSTFLPRQFNDNVTVYSAYLEKNFRFGKFNFLNVILCQRSSADVIRIPQLATQHSLYYEDRWFNRVMNVQIGIDARWNSDYYADAYMPALGMYYLQNEKKIGNYPFADFFVNMKVRQARIFLKVEHFLSGVLGNNYYLAPHYPAPDRSFKVGINWVFYD